MKIQFYIPKDEIVPTQFRVKIDDKYDVYYDKVPNEFAWDFTFWNEAKDCYETLLDEMVSRMCTQSEDHGASWCETKREVVEKSELWGSIVVRVYFRIRDSW